MYSRAVLREGEVGKKKISFLSSAGLIGKGLKSSLWFYFFSLALPPSQSLFYWEILEPAHTMNTWLLTSTTNWDTIVVYNHKHT